MQTTIDAAGRLVIPKALRTAMGVTPHTPVDVSFSEGRIVIEFVPAHAEVQVQNGLPVIQRSSDEPTMSDELVRQTLEATRR